MMTFYGGIAVGIIGGLLVSACAALLVVQYLIDHDYEIIKKDK